MSSKELLEAARVAREGAYAPYSLSARGVGFVLGCVQELNFLPLVALAYRLLQIQDVSRRRLAAAALALAGMLGAQTISEYGTVFHDSVVSIGILGGPAILACCWPRLWAPGAGWMAPAALAGVCLGLAFGLKQSSAFYAVAGCAAFLLLPGPFWRRFGLSFVSALVCWPDSRRPAGTGCFTGGSTTPIRCSLSTTTSTARPGAYHGTTEAPASCRPASTCGRY